MYQVVSYPTPLKAVMNPVYIRPPFGVKHCQHDVFLNVQAFLEKCVHVVDCGLQFLCVLPVPRAVVGRNSSVETWYSELFDFDQNIVLVGPGYEYRDRHCRYPCEASPPPCPIVRDHFRPSVAVKILYHTLSQAACNFFWRQSLLASRVFGPAKGAKTHP